MVSSLMSGSLAAMLALTGPSGFAQTARTPTGAAGPTTAVAVKVAALEGTGCRAGTTAVAMSPDNQAFTVTYNDYIAQAGPGVPLASRTRSCQLTLQLAAPTGFRFAVARTDIRGFADLTRGITAVQSSRYWFSGTFFPRYRTHLVSGPVFDDWQFTDTVAGTLPNLGPCASTSRLIVDTQLTVLSGLNQANSTSWIGMDSTDGTAAATTYHLGWQHC